MAENFKTKLFQHVMVQYMIAMNKIYLQHFSCSEHP